MKGYLRRATSLLLVLIFSAPCLPGYAKSTPAATPRPMQKKVKEVKNVRVRKGKEVVEQVKKLKEKNKDVRAAFEVFERKGRKMRIEYSQALTGKIILENAGVAGVGATTSKECKNCGVFQKAAFGAEDMYNDGVGVELTFVPAMSIEYEWQGTMIASRYDDYGNLVEQKVANIVMFMPDPYVYQWEIIYEAPVVNGVVEQPAWTEGMANPTYELGTSWENQPVAFWNNYPELQQEYPELTQPAEYRYYEQPDEDPSWERDRPIDRPAYRTVARADSKQLFQKIGFTDPRTPLGVNFFQSRTPPPRNRHPGRIQDCPICQADRARERAQLRAWGGCTAAWCGGSALGCAAANWWNAEIAWGPCTAAGCITAAVGCTWGTLWGR